MSRNLTALSLAFAFSGSIALAEAPRVAVDIAPVHSLVARVMQGLGTPDLIVQPGASPHEYSLRPSEARALQEADLVFWVGDDLTPWMKDAIGTLSSDAKVTTLIKANGTLVLGFREGALFEAHQHDHAGGEAHGDEAHDHDHEAHDHDAHDHDAPEKDAHDHEAHSEGAEKDHAHDPDGVDPHAWLAPENAAAWIDVIAGELSAADPENAQAYLANAAAARTELDGLIREIDAALAPVRGKRFIVFHDAYQYFEVSFDLAAAGAISLSDASDPSPARIAEIQARIAEEGIDCILAEPQFNPGLVATVSEGTQAGTGVLDPLGSDLQPGADLYPQLMRALARSLAACF